MYTYKSLKNYKSIHKTEIEGAFKYLKFIHIHFNPFHETGSIAKTVYNMMSSSRLRSANPKGCEIRMTLLDDIVPATLELTWLNDKIQRINLSEIENIPLLLREIIFTQRMIETDLVYRTVKRIPVSVPQSTDPDPVLPNIKNPRPYVTSFRPLERPEQEYWSRQAPFVHGAIKGEKTKAQKHKEQMEASKSGKQAEYDVTDDLLALDWYNNPALLDRYAAKQVTTAKMKMKQEERMAKLLGERMKKKQKPLEDSE